MHVVTAYPDGIFCWLDLAATDADAAKAFYSGLFGWEMRDMLTDMGTIYTNVQIDGLNVAGLSVMQPDMLAQGIPAFWTSYIKTDDIDAAAARITAAGGNVFMPPMDVMQEGRLALAMDPTGAPFGMWQPRNHIGAQLVNMPNTLVWNELQTRAGATAAAFYAKAFDWMADRNDTGYTVFVRDGRRHAGMIEMDENWGADVPPNWGIYFLVTDIDATLARAQDLGGRVLVPKTPAGQMGFFAVLQDPQGGVFHVMQSDPQFVDPPPGA